jgi:hypothetical protein
MDNYYTSPTDLILLRKRGIYAIGTVNKNRCMVRSQIILIKDDFKKECGGYVRMAVCEFAKMQDFCWNDNNPVHILSTADSSEPRTMVW